MLAVNWLGFLEASHLCEGPGPGFHGMMDLLAQLMQDLAVTEMIHGSIYV